MYIEILDETGAVINTIAASKEFAEAHYPGRWRKVLVPSLPASAEPRSCTPAQGLIALYALKQLAEQDILDAIAQITDTVQRYTATIGYQRATTWERGSSTMQTMAQLLGLTDADLDELFAYAVGVTV